MVKKSKKLLIMSTALSLFAVLVAAVSTYAWFVAETQTVDSVTDAGLVKSDSTNLTIDGVTGYKFKYNDVSYGVTDYENGEPVSYSSSATTNADQADRKELDYPTQGEGYYVVGNSTWVDNYETETGESVSVDTVWTYGSGLKLDDDLVDGNNNKATYNSVFLSAGAEFRIRHHYLTIDGDQTVTESYSDSWVTITLADNSGLTTTAARLDGNNVVIKDGQSGYYNIYLTNSNQLALYPLELRPNPRSIRQNPKKAAPSAGSRLFLKPNSNWTQSSAWFALDVYNGSGHKWVRMTGNSDGYYYATVPATNGSAWTNLIFLRMNPSNTGNSGTGWPSDVWNQTNDLTVGSGDTYTVADGAWSNGSGSWSYYSSVHNIRIMGGYSGSSWSNLGTLSFSGTQNTFTCTVSMGATKAFKVVDGSTYYGDSHYLDVNSTYFKTDNDGSDDDIELKSGCKFTVNYYIDSHNFRITNISALATTYYTMKVYKKITSPASSTYVEEYNDTGFEDTYFDPGDPEKSYSGFTWCGHWYHNSSFTEEHTSADYTYGDGSTTSSRAILYTYYDANAISITIIQKYLNNAGTAVDSTATSSYAAANVVTNTYATVTYTFPSAPSAHSGYSFYKYGTTTTGGTTYDPGDTVSKTSNTTFYAIFKPIKYTITGIYKFFENNGTTSVSGPSLANNTDYAYGSGPFVASNPSTTRYKYYKSATTTFYVFEFAGWYTNTACTTPYANNTTYTGNGTLYAKMVAKAMTTVYVDTSSANWTSPKVRVFKDGEEDFGLNNSLTSGKVFSGNNYIYKLTVPTDYNLIFTAAGAYGANVQTVDVGVTTTSTDSSGNQKGSSDWIYLTDKNGSNYYKFVWNTFYGNNLTEGYYLVGSSSFEAGGSSNTPWTFALSNKMSTNDLPLSVVAKKETRTLSAGMEFKIWHYSTTSGRDGEYAVLNSDAETQATLQINASGNIEVKTGVNGTFDIYVTETSYKVMVKDVNAGSKLYVKYGGTTNNYTMGKTPSGSSYWAVYEQGIQVTTSMASSGTYIGIVRKTGGKKLGYGTKASNYSFVNATADSQTFDGLTFSCLKIDKAGYYNFYLTSSGTIMITSLPYQVNGSDVKTTGGDDGYYLVPYSTTYGNGTYRNGLKMNIINGEGATTAEGNKNIASYSRYRATAGEKFMIKYFSNNETVYSPLEIATDSVTSACLAHEGGGIYRIKVSGVYNIFMYRTNTGESVSVAKDSLSDFSRLNSIPSNATSTSAVKNANTTLILDVTFTVTTPTAMNINLDSVISGAGLSSYIVYGVFVDSDYSGASGSSDTQKIYNFFRADTQYNTLKAMRSYSTVTATATAANGQHHAYIVIDYDPSQVASMPTGINNNFYFVVRATQPSA